MKIERINHYHDDRFLQTVLDQHGAFLVDGRPVGCLIDGPTEAVVFSDFYEGLEPLLAEFRFYAGHISRFVKPEWDQFCDDFFAGKENN